MRARPPSRSPGSGSEPGGSAAGAADSRFDCGPGCPEPFGEFGQNDSGRMKGAAWSSALPNARLVSYDSFPTARFPRLVSHDSFRTTRFPRLVSHDSFRTTRFVRLVSHGSFPTTRFVRLVSHGSFPTTRFVRLVSYDVANPFRFPHSHKSRGKPVIPPPPPDATAVALRSNHQSLATCCRYFYPHSRRIIRMNVSLRGRTFGSNDDSRFLTGTEIGRRRAATAGSRERPAATRGVSARGRR